MAFEPRVSNCFGLRSEHPAMLMLETGKAEHIKAVFTPQQAYPGYFIVYQTSWKKIHQ